MKKKLLFGNNISNIGKAVAKNFQYFNFKTSFCGNSYPNIMNNLEKEDFDGLCFFVNCDSKELWSFMKNVKEMYPHLKVYPILVGNSDVNSQKLMQNGAENCFRLPITSENLCFEMINDFFYDEEIIVSIEIAKFLIENSFPIHVKGFYFLCQCIEMVIDDPRLFTNFSKLLYPSVREKTEASVAWIERSIRNLSKMVYKAGVRFENYPDDKNLTNKTLIQALVNEYCTKNNIKRR